MATELDGVGKTLNCYHETCQHKHDQHAARLRKIGFQAPLFNVELTILQFTIYNHYMQEPFQPQSQLVPFENLPNYIRGVGLPLEGFQYELCISIGSKRRNEIILQS